MGGRALTIVFQAKRHISLDNHISKTNSRFQKECMYFLPVWYNGIKGRYFAPSTTFPIDTKLVVLLKMTHTNVPGSFITLVK